MAWIVDDRASDRRTVKELLAGQRLNFREIESHEAFIESLKTAGSSGPVPDVVILDLRLPWVESGRLASNALTVGLECLALLRQEPTTATCPVVVFSAFPHDVLVEQQLTPHQPLTVVDKSDPEPLATKVANLLPDNEDRVVDRARRFLLKHERALKRVGEIAGAVAAIAALIAGFVAFIL